MSRSLLDQPIYKFIDAKLLLDGHITTVDVSDAFGLGRQKVSSVFTKYRNERPDNMHHDLHRKCYVRGNEFTPLESTDTLPEEYLNAVRIVFGK